MASRSNLNISTDSTRGATIYTAYTDRKVRAYPVFENEIKTFNLFNTLATIAIAIGSSFLSFAVGILTNAMFVEDVTAAGEIMSRVVAPVLGILAVVAFILSVWAAKSRGTTWDTIKNESSSDSS